MIYGLQWVLRVVDLLSASTRISPKIIRSAVHAAYVRERTDSSRLWIYYLFVRSVHEAREMRGSEVPMKTPREPNVRIRTAQPFDPPRNMARRNSGLYSHRTILTLGLKSACQDVADPGAQSSSGEAPGSRTP